MNAPGSTKLRNVTSAIGIVDPLRRCLDHGAGGNLAANLEALCDYRGRRRVQANAADGAAGVDEVADLLRVLESAWDDLAPAGKPS